MRKLLLIPVFLSFPACQRTDGEKLIKISQITTEKVREAMPSRTPFGDIAPEASPVGRVRSRIKGDIYLQKAPIQVTEDEEGIRLRGSVPSKDHLERAEQLASQTVGVTRVINELSIRE